MPPIPLVLLGSHAGKHRPRPTCAAARIEISILYRRIIDYSALAFIQNRSSGVTQMPGSESVFEAGSTPLLRGSDRRV